VRKTGALCPGSPDCAHFPFFATPCLIACFFSFRTRPPAECPSRSSLLASFVSRFVGGVIFSVFVAMCSFVGTRVRLVRGAGIRDADTAENTTLFPNFRLSQTFGLCLALGSAKNTHDGDLTIHDQAVRATTTPPE